MIINDIIWKQKFVDKLAFKHQVSIEEAEEVLCSGPIIRKVAKGHVKNENVYAAYKQISNGRYLIVFFVNKKEIEHYLFLDAIWITQKGNIMKSKKKKTKSCENIDPLPDTFKSEEKAGEFWDTHSTSDYEEYLEPVDITIDIQKRHFEIEIDKESFIALNTYAKKVNKPVKNLASSILKEKLVSA